MRKARAWLCRLAGVFNRKKREAELAEEIESHLHMHVDDNLRSGMAPEEARRLALIKLGGIAPTQESYRDRLGLPFFEALVDDLRYSFRMLRKTPAFTTVAFLTLILGIGANTTIFTITNALFLRHLPVPSPIHLALITYDPPRSKWPLTLKMFNDIKRRQQVFDGMMAWADYSFRLSENGDVRILPGALVGDSFSTLELKPALGRLLTPADDEPRDGPEGWAGVISYRYWQEAFQSDPGVIGRTKMLESVPVTIVGVMPAGFAGVNIGSQSDIVLPEQFAVYSERKRLYPFVKGHALFTVIGRMKSGVTLADARNDIEHFAASVVAQSDLPRHVQDVFFAGAHLTVSSGAAGYWGGRSSYKQPLLALQVLVAIILLLCCTNLAGLFSARAAARNRDLVIRSALGAYPLRLARELLIEDLILVGGATVLTLLFVSLPANALLNALAGARRLPVFVQTRPDGNVLAFTLGAVCCVVLITGILPAWRSARTDFNTNLSESRSQELNPKARNQVRSWFLPLQVGISVVLVFASGLFAGTLYRVLTTRLGFQTEGIIIFPTGLESRPGTPEQRSALYDQIFDRLNHMPGIEIATGESFPVLKNIRSEQRFVSLGPGGNGRTNIDLSGNVVGIRYFEAMDIKVVQGRDFDRSDEHSSAHACILNESAAKHLFSLENAVGSYLNYVDHQSGKTIRYDIIGVVEDTKFTNVREQVADSIYVPFHPDNITPELQLVIKSNDVDAAISSARKVLRQIFPDAPLLEPITMQEQFKQSIAQERLLAILSISCAALALLLTAIGIYGVLAFQVAQRTTEIGVRIALGASQAGILRMVLQQALLPLAIGALFGTIAALASSHLIVSLLYQVRPDDLGIYIGTLLVIGLVGFFAAWMPARRAAAVDPIIALRCE